jgi:cell division transport system permease protein
MVTPRRMRVQGVSARPPTETLPKTETPIVPADSIAGRALVAVIAIMAFLAAVTLGAVLLVRGAAGEWQSAVAREVTIQVLPAQGRDLDVDLKKAADLAVATPGVDSVRVYSKTESERLLEPWLGAGLTFDDLPVPRLVVVRVSADAQPHLNTLRKALSSEVAGATLDDHRGWIDRMRAMARTSVMGGVVVLMLVLTATMLSVAFATRGAMASNRPVIEVLHIIGARDGYIAGQFQRHFLWLGLKGGAIGGVAAMVVFALAGSFGDWFKGTAGEQQVAALFGSFAIGPVGYAAIVLLVAVIAGVTAGTSRLTVFRTLGMID